MMHKRIAKIVSTFLGFEDHDIFTAMVDLDYGGSAQSAGGYCLANLDKSPTDFTAKFVQGVIGAAGVRRWEALPGRTLFVLFENDDWNARPIGFEPLPTEGGKPFLFAELQATEIQ